MLSKYRRLFTPVKIFYFSIYYQGAITKIDSYEPDFYFAKNNIIYYSYHSELKIIYDGVIHKDKLIEKENIFTGENCLLYLDNTNRPKYFYKGKTFDRILYKKPVSMHLNRDLPVLQSDANTIGFFYEGKLYEYGYRSN